MFSFQSIVIYQADSHGNWTILLYVMEDGLFAKEYTKIGDEFMQKDDLLMPTELCWQTGNFTDDCECELCDHKEECSGYEDDDED